jgi:hypothetical protein
MSDNRSQDTAHGDRQASRQGETRGESETRKPRPPVDENPTGGGEPGEGEGTLSRRSLLQAVGAVGAGGFAVDRVRPRPPPDVEAPDREPPRARSDYETRTVPGDYERIQAAVTAAEAGDLVLVDPGEYNEEVVVADTPNLTIRGTDRNEVILDGKFNHRNGITATVDGVVVENMTARNYNYNGFYWTDVDGYRASYLTAYNNGDYGIYAFGAENGRFDNCYASGHPDSGFYIGQCQPCNAVLEDLVAENNALGYSGTNAGGALVIRDSVWRDNMAGIVPNTLDSEDLAPQRGALVENNEVSGNNNAEAPTKAIGYPVFGTGITVAGGSENVVVDNDVRDHVNFGIAVIPMIDDQVWLARDNRIEGNTVRDSGRTDLGLGALAGAGNRFADNDVGSTRPASLQGFLGAVGRAVGDPWVTLPLARSFLQTEIGDYPSGDWKEQPEPPSQPTMSNPEGPPREAVGPERSGGEE